MGRGESLTLGPPPFHGCNLPPREQWPALDPLARPPPAPPSHLLPEERSKCRRTVSRLPGPPGPQLRLPACHCLFAHHLPHQPRGQGPRLIHRVHPAVWVLAQESCPQAAKLAVGVGKKPFTPPTWTPVSADTSVPMPRVGLGSALSVGPGTSFRLSRIRAPWGAEARAPRRELSAPHPPRLRTLPSLTHCFENNTFCLWGVRACLWGPCYAFPLP